jgi:hypothetical protein
VQKRWVPLQWPIMFPRVQTQDSLAVERETQATYQGLYPEGDPSFVATAFSWLRDIFSGRYKDYQAIDAVYHDLEHTMQGTLCMMRLLSGRAAVGARPLMPQRMCELGLIAMLFHDTGYLKKRGDHEGTGAKYTLTHVTRSVLFAEEFLLEQGVSIREIRAVQNMIRCTGVHVDLTRIPFQIEIEKIVGFALGTGDLLGQMSADDYVDKLPILYAEFEESARFYEGKMTGILAFSSADELIRRTPDFWTGYVLPKLEEDFWGLHKFLRRPYPHGPNEYIERVHANMERLRRQLASGS